MIVLARESRGTSQTQLAELVGISKAAMNRIEHGEQQPTDEQLARISAATHYPPTLFHRTEQVRGTDSFCFHHRKRTSMPAKKLAIIQADMHLAQLQTKRLLADVEVETTLEFPTLDPAEFDGPTGVARMVRAGWRVGSGPIPNMVRLVEAAGGIVLFRDFGTQKLDGMSGWAKNMRPVLYLNSQMPVARIRWMIALEVGHLVMHWTTPNGNPEDEADEFARELLVPSDESSADLRSLTFKALPQLKAYWRVSMWALVKAAESRGLLPENKAKSLYVQMSRLGWRHSEPFPFPPEHPTLVADAVSAHLRDGFSTDELAGLVDLEPEEFVALYSPPPADKHLRLA